MKFHYAVIVLISYLYSAKAQVFVDPLPPMNTNSAFSFSPLPEPQAWSGTPIDWCSTLREATQWVTNNQTGEITTQRCKAIELAGGLNYLDSGGAWRESKDLIELTPDGAAALRAPTKVYFDPTLYNSPGSGITLVTRSNLVLKTRPVGIYLFDALTQKEVLLAPLQDSVDATFQPPNQIIYPSAFHSDVLEADLRITCTMAGMECDTIITHQPKISPQMLSMDPSRTLLQVRHAWTAPAMPKVATKQDASGLNDTMIDFGDILFAPGKAFSWDGTASSDTNLPARINIFNAATDDLQVPVGKMWRNGNPSILTESVRWADIQPNLAKLPEMAQATPAPRGDSRSSPPNESPSETLQKKRIELAEAQHGSPGLVLDYITVSGNGDYTFQTYNGANTYVLNGNNVFNGNVVFQPHCIIKRSRTGASLILAGSVICNGTCSSPSILTEMDDNMYGEQRGQNCAVTTDGPALWVWWNMPGGTTIGGMDIRYAQTAVQFDGEFCGETRLIKDSALESCQTGIYANSCAVSIQNSANSLVTTATSTANCGSVSGIWGSSCPRLSLQSSVVAGMQALAQGHSSANLSLFNGDGHGNFTYNQSCWVYGIKGYTAFSPWNSPGGYLQGGGVLVTPRHALTTGVGHGMGNFTGRTFTFVGKSGTSYLRQCTSHIDVNFDYEDIGLLEFDSDLRADEFDFVKVLPADVVNKLTFDMSVGTRDGCLSRYLPCVALGQDKIASAYDFYLYQPPSGFGTGPYASLTPSLWLPSFSFPYIPRPGDSGSPIFIVINNELVLLGIWKNGPILNTFAGARLENPTARNDYNGYLGFQFTLNSGPIVPMNLGRLALPGNSHSHALNIVDGLGNAIGGTFADTGGQGVTVGQFLWATLWPPFPTLSVGPTYYLLSQESNVNGSDQWYDFPGVQLSSGQGNIYWPVASSDHVAFTTYPGNTNKTFVPVNFQYYLPPIAGTAAMPGGIVNELNARLPSGYHINTVDLSSFPEHLR